MNIIKRLKSVVRKVLSMLGFKDLKLKYVMKYYRVRLHLRYRRKNKNGEKINLVFVCHRPAVWNSLKTVFESAIQDEMFNVTIVTVPCKKQLPDLYFNHEIYESEGAEQFWKDYPCRVLQGYNYETKEWLDLKTLEPDYIFFQQPYNCMRPSQYHSNEIAKFATLCYIDYGFPTSAVSYDECLPLDYLQNVSLYFAVGENDAEKVRAMARLFNTKIIMSGFPRFDLLTQKKNCVSTLWKNIENFKVIWTPRWTTNENNCHFFKYKDKFFNLLEKYSDIDLLYRPHPQAFLEYIGTKEMTQVEADEYVASYHTKSNAAIDFEKDYMPQFWSSDCLVTDLTSLIPEYLITGKPVIYCKNDNSLFDIEGEWTGGLYYARSWNEVEQCILNLWKGTDPLKLERERLTNKNFYINPIGAGMYVKNIIKKDYIL